MTGVIAVIPKFQFSNATGTPLASGSLTVYLAGTTTLTNTFQDYQLISANTNPVILDSRGECVLWLDSTVTYKFVLKNSAGVVQWTQDNLSGAGAAAAALESALAASGGSAKVGFLPSSGLVSTVQAKLRERISVFDFLSAAQISDVTSNTKALDVSAAIQSATTAAAALGKTLLFPAGTYRLLSYVSLPSNTDWVGEIGTVIYLDPAMTLGAVIGGTARAVYANIATNVSFSKIKFISLKTGLTQAVTICFSGVTRLRVGDCAFENFGNATYYAQGAIIFGGSDIRFTNCRFFNNSGDGLALSNGSTNYIISGCEFSSNLDWGLAFVIGCNQGVVQGCLFNANTSTSTGVDRCTNVQFIGNTMIGGEHGIRIAEFAISSEKNNHISMIGNNISTSSIAGISVEAMKAVYGEYTIVGNIIEGSSNQGIRIVDAEIGTISGNTIYSCINEGILFNAISSGRATGSATVVGNKIHTCTYGIRQITGSGSTTKISVFGNDIGPVSVSAIALLSADYIESSNVNYMDISKTLNFPSSLTSFTASQGGTVSPGNFQGFLPFYLGGVLRKIPFFNA
jgi:parallel beta-helix repeat protein